MSISESSRSQLSSTGNSATGATCCTPAFATTPSSRPKRWRASSTTRAFSSATVRSAPTESSPAGSRSTASTRAPAPRSASVTAAPIPAAAPVTR